jgi:hypothetical protein
MRPGRAAVCQSGTPEADDTITTIHLDAIMHATTITLAGEQNRRYALQLHIPDAATLTAGVLEVATPLMRSGMITVGWGLTMPDKFTWHKGDVVISPVTEETWDLAHYSGEKHLLVTTLDGLVQHLLQRDADVDVHEENGRILQSPKAKNMPPELRKELLQHGYLAIVVQGTPAVLTATGSVATIWKESVAIAARGAFPQGYVLAEPCHVELVFHLSPIAYAMTALHNLLKATIDGLGQAVFAASPGTKLTKWHTEDWWITSLAASKRLADGEPHLEFKLTPGTQPYTDSTENHNLLLDVSIPGGPPLFATNAQKERAWREQLAAKVDTPIVVVPTTPLAASLVFNIEPSRMKNADIDNFCVPAMTGLKAISLPARNVVELYATKQVVKASTGLSTRMRIWTLSK